MAYPGASALLHSSGCAQVELLAADGTVAWRLAPALRTLECLGVVDVPGRHKRLAYLRVLEDRGLCLKRLESLLRARLRLMCLCDRRPGEVSCLLTQWDPDLTPSVVHYVWLRVPTTGPVLALHFLLLRPSLRLLGLLAAAILPH